MMNELTELERDLYSAWVAYYELRSGAPDAEVDAINERCRVLYERAYDELGPRLTQEAIRNARHDTGDTI